MLSKYIHTIKKVLDSPRDVVDNFLIGNKGDHQHPFIYCTIGVILIVLLNSVMVDFSFTPELTDIESDDETVQALASWIEIANVRASTQFLPLMMGLLFIPMLSLPGLFFFREELEGFYSNLVLNTYMVGTSILALVLLIPVWIFVDVPLSDLYMNSTMPSVFAAVIGIWVYKQYFNVSSIRGWIKIISSYITGYVLFVIIKGFAAGVTGYMIFAVKRIAELSGT